MACAAGVANDMADRLAAIAVAVDEEGDEAGEGGMITSFVTLYGAGSTGGCAPSSTILSASNPARGLLPINPLAS